MIKRDELSDPASCLNRADMDEPIFVLKATDESAPDMVVEWAQRYWLRKVKKNEWNETAAQKYLSAMDLAKQMVRWREKRLREQGLKEDKK